MYNAVQGEVLHRLFGVEDTVAEFLVIVFHRPYACVGEERIAVFHLDDERIERVDYLLAVCDDDVAVLLVGHSRHKVFDKRLVDGELHHLRVNEYEL